MPVTGRTCIERLPPCPHRFGRDDERLRRPDLLNVFAGILIRGTLRFPFRARDGEWRGMVDAALTGDAPILADGARSTSRRWLGLPHRGEQRRGVLLREPHRMDVDLVVGHGGVGRELDRDVGLRRRVGVERHGPDRRRGAAGRRVRRR